ncbi:MAG: hypothetical protein J6Y94_08960, partial [Bacteriovoracaceae bacterium]|nr:hypothetical protein [Bacteriovoracaceae bacterium]
MPLFRLALLAVLMLAITSCGAKNPSNTNLPPASPLPQDRSNATVPLITKISTETPHIHLTEKQQEYLAQRYSFGPNFWQLPFLDQLKDFPTIQELNTTDSIIAGKYLIGELLNYWPHTGLAAEISLKVVTGKNILDLYLNDYDFVGNVLT